MADYRQVARQAAQRFGLDPEIFERQISAESGFNPNAVSPAGARGIAQIMPATAKGWGVDPGDPVASLNAAAKNMARYVQQFGSYRNALVAYNAGPGAVGGKLPAETSNYISKILGGKGGGGGSAGTPDTTTTSTVPDRAGELANRRALVLQNYLQQEDPHNALLQVPGLFTPVAETKQQTTTIPGMPAQGGGSVKGKSPLLELIHHGGKGNEYAVKNGQAVDPSVYSGVWAGHADHVHVAAGPKTVIKLGELAQQMGLNVGENPHFGGVHPVHAKNSYHYRNEAIDVSGDPRKMNAYAKAVERIYGLK